MFAGEDPSQFHRQLIIIEAASEANPESKAVNPDMTPARDPNQWLLEALLALLGALGHASGGQGGLGVAIGNLARKVF